MKALVEQGAWVIACCYTEEGRKAALAAGAKLAPRLDLSDSSSIEELVAEVKEHCTGGLWGLVHNAGTALPGFVEFQRLENYRYVMEVNFFGVVALTRRLLPLLKPTKGRVVIVSSVDGIVSLPGNAPYDASKFAVEAYADALRVELSIWNVHVSVINPSTLKTPLALGFFEKEIETWENMEKAEPEGEWKETWTREWLEEYVKVNTERLKRMAQEPRHAIHDILHALNAIRPKLRYLSGTFAKTFFYALWKMPEHWSLNVKKGMLQPLPPVKEPSKKSS